MSKGFFFLLINKFVQIIEHFTEICNVLPNLSKIIFDKNKVVIFNENLM